MPGRVTCANVAPTAELAMGPETGTAAAAELPPAATPPGAPLPGELRPPAPGTDRPEGEAACAKLSPRRGHCNGSEGPAAKGCPTGRGAGAAGCEATGPGTDTDAQRVPAAGVCGPGVPTEVDDHATCWWMPLLTSAVATGGTEQPGPTGIPGTGGRPGAACDSAAVLSGEGARGGRSGGQAAGVVATLPCTTAARASPSYEMSGCQPLGALLALPQAPSLIATGSAGAAAGTGAGLHPAAVSTGTAAGLGVGQGTSAGPPGSARPATAAPCAGGTCANELAEL